MTLKDLIDFISAHVVRQWFGWVGKKKRNDVTDGGLQPLGPEMMLLKTTLSPDYNVKLLIPDYYTKSMPPYPLSL